jgi:hypothetical protein
MKYLAQYESDGFGWIDIGEPSDWYPAFQRYDASWTGRPIRIVELTDSEEFIREVSASEILVGYPNREKS